MNFGLHPVFYLAYCVTLFVAAFTLGIVFLDVIGLLLFLL